jgi:hypothetical protein
MIRDLAAPPWVDSIHHGLISNLMIENGGLPDTYAPFLPAGANYYHFGFHTTFSTFIWLTGFEIHQGMLIFGQILNASIVLAIYLFVITMTNNRAAGLVGALVVAVFTLMPAYYTSWGRYTHLAGLLVLPVGFRFFVDLVHTEGLHGKKTKTIWGLGIITYAGLFLIHYRVAVFLGLLILAYLVIQVHPRDWLSTLSKLVLIGIFSMVLILPWLPGLLTSLLLPKGTEWVGTGLSLSQIPWKYLKPGLGIQALAMAGFGLVLGLFLFKRFAITVILWTGLMYLLANLSVFGLPGSGFVNPVSMEITLFMPIAVLSGFAVGGTLEFLEKYISESWQIGIRALIIIIGAGVAILGTQNLLPKLNPITFLAREADFPAIAWIDRNIPDEEVFLINPTGWGYGLYMGNDGGYWISPLTGHQTTTPPVIYGLGKPEEIDTINQLVEKLLPIGEDPQALWKLMRNNNIRYIYLGVRGGILSPKVLSESSLFITRYQQGGTWVFEALENE